MNPQDDRSAINPEKTPLFIGVGVAFEGLIRHTGPVDERAVILGSLSGNVEWNGILQVPKGGKVTVSESLRCREMMIGGEIVGANDDVVIETGLLRLGESASIQVATVSVPPGGLEQSRGSVINAKLRMTSDHPFAGAHPEAAAQGQQDSAPRLTSAPTAAAAPARESSEAFVDPGFAHGNDDTLAPIAVVDLGGVSGLEQVETRHPTAA